MDFDPRSLKFLCVGIGILVALELYDRWPLMALLYGQKGVIPESILYTIQGQPPRWTLLGMSGIFNHDQQASVQAIPADGYLFLNWEGANFSDPYASSTNFTDTPELAICQAASQPARPAPITMTCLFNKLNQSFPKKSLLNCSLAGF